MKSIIDKNYRWFLLSIVFLALAVRVWNLGNNSFFGDFDEYYTAKTAVGFYEDKVPNQPIVDLNSIQSSSFSETLADANRDNGNSFIYNLSLHLFAKVTGSSDYAFRLFSVIFDVISILTIASIGRILKINKDRILLACLIYALFPFAVGFSNIIRTYSFSTAITLLLIRAIISADRKEKAIVPVLSIALLASVLFLAHYLTYYVLVISAAFFLLYKKSISIHFKRVWSGFAIAGVVCLGYLYINYQGLNTISKRSKSYEDVAASGKENSRNLQVITPGVFMTKTAHYLNTYYLGSNTVEKHAKAYVNESTAIVVSFVLLLLPLILFWNLSPDASNKKWLILFAALFVAGNLSAIALSLISGHMTSLNPKYSMFSIPFFIMATCFFVRFNFLTKATLAFMILVSCYQLMLSLNNKGMKKINIEMAGLSESKEYLCRDYPEVKSALQNLLNNHRGDTLFVSHVNDLVFIKCAMIDLDYSSAYILKNDSTARFKDRVADIHFTIPD